MKVLIVYDSVHGNTEKIARAIGDAIAGEVEVRHAEEVNVSESDTFDLIIVGSPTHGGRPTPAVRDFLKKIPASALKGTSVAAFDTRLPAKWVRIFGYAAGRIGDSLKRKGGNLAAPPEPFFVEGTEGPLKEGELDRAAGWAEEIVKSIE
ncbi:flavodoxin family protein [Candidatus Bathyarchaeota archaeon]|nr:flavodoxin family protein [Candidatus Bathyarchaeota archaeon]